MVYARKGALHVPTNLSAEDRVAWMRNVANNLIGSILVDKSSSIFLPAKVHRGDRIKLFSFGNAVGCDPSAICRFDFSVCF